MHRELGALTGLFNVDWVLCQNPPYFVLCAFLRGLRASTLSRPSNAKRCMERFESGSIWRSVFHGCVLICINDNAERGSQSFAPKVPDHSVFQEQKRRKLDSACHRVSGVSGTICVRSSRVLWTGLGERGGMPATCKGHCHLPARMPTLKLNK